MSFAARLLSLFLLVGPADEGPADVTPFEPFTFSARVQVHREQKGLDQLEALGRFGLGPESDGADPDQEEVFLLLGPFSRRLPPGSFKRRVFGGITIWDHRKQPDDAFRLTLRRQGSVWTFRAAAKKLDLSRTENPVTLVLRVGDDEGRATQYYGQGRRGVWSVWDYPPLSDLDADDDGVRRDQGDCDDQAPSIHPGAPERCNATDDDCDGAIDEGFDLGAVCNAGAGACERTGVTVCSASGAGTVCNAAPGAPLGEICNGFDDDCDGETDEELGTLSCGTGLCSRTVPACLAGSLQICAPGAPAPEVCGNATDEDCDGRDLACPTLSLAFTSPASLATVNESPVTVSGAVVTGEAVEVACNDVVAQLAGVSFSADVPLHEGRNAITCVGQDLHGGVATGVLRVTLDTTAPAVFLESPRDGQVTSEPEIAVTGTFNDVIGDAFGASAVSVVCNGRPAQVGNRTFLAASVPLQPGANVVVCTATDAAGNSKASEARSVIRLELAGQRIERVSGDGQSAPVGSLLAQPLVVRLRDAAGLPVSGRTVLFRVRRGSGALVDGSGSSRELSVITAADGSAAAAFRLGQRAGAGDHRVTATALGFAGEVELTATATSSAPNRILAVTGDAQRAATGSLLPLPLVALVTDAEGNPVSGVPVTFRVLRGGGNLDGDDSQTVATGANGRAAAVLRLGLEEGTASNVVAADFPGLANLPAVFLASAFLPGRVEDTRVSGVVLDNANLPIPGATVRLQGTTLETVTDAEGRFLLHGAPVGTIHLFVDGRTGPRPETFTPLEFELTTIAGRENTVGMPILIPALDTASAKRCGGPAACTLQMAGVHGMTVTVHPHSATFRDGSREGDVLLTQVHLDKVPMVPPDGALLIPAWTLQPGGTHFDPPASVTIPNTAGLPPGERAEIFQFDHDIGDFVSIGMGTVTEDGSLVVSDPGYGITSAGWGGFRPPPPPTTSVQGPAPPLPNAINPVSGSNGTLAHRTAGSQGDGRFSLTGAYRSDEHGQPKAHDGIDVVAPIGTPVVATDGGRVLSADFHEDAGWHVIVDHGNGIFSKYQHLSAPPLVSNGQVVPQGTRLGGVGVSGNAAGTDQPHLHFEIYGNQPTAQQGGVALDPTYIVQRPPGQISSPPIGGGAPSVSRPPRRKVEIDEEDNGDTTATGPGPLSDARCTLMSLSRTIELLPGTAFVLPNVPADLRTLRARLRCETADGRLLGGHSPFLVPQADGVTFVEPLLIEPIAATPQSAVLTAPATTLTAIGQTAQLELTGWLPDGSTVDLTPSASGTIYRSSRPQVAAVSIDGMVEATAGGVALVTAVHEGLVATLSFRVETAADADADGLPDDFESAYSCLDPGTADAAADPDADGLTNLQELQTGTDPCLADTDGDGLSDAEEGTAGSNPLLPDSDFDGLLDGSEPNPQGDGDGDGRINVLDPDQDDDGLPDGIEVRICGSPTCANPAADNDGDGLSNLDEVELGADPTRGDTDGDGLSDSAEILGGTDAIDPDMDGDGFADGFETSQGSDPRDAGSVPNVPPHTEASGSLLSILNSGSPAPPATAEAVSRVLSLLSTAAPPPPTVLEVASRTLSLLSTAVPAPPVLLETDSPLVSVNNSPP